MSYLSRHSNNLHIPALLGDTQGVTFTEVNKYLRR